MKKQDVFSHFRIEKKRGFESGMFLSGSPVLSKTNQIRICALYLYSVSQAFSLGFRAFLALFQAKNDSFCM